MPPDIKNSLENDPELRDALRELKARPFMGYPAVRFYIEPNPPKIVRWVMRAGRGYIENERQAEYFIFGMVIVAVIFSIFLFIKSFYHPGPKSAPEVQFDDDGRMIPNEYSK